MSSNRLFFAQVNRAFDMNGATVPGAFMRVFENNSSTLAQIFASLDPDVPLAQPVQADANGVFPDIYVNSAAPLRVLISAPDPVDSNLIGVTLPGYPMDNIVPLASEVTGAANIPFSPTEALPQENVQAAIEAAAASSSGQTELVARSLTAWVTGGTLDAFSLTPDPALVDYGSWSAFLVQFNRAPTGASTLNISGLGTRQLRKIGPAGTAIDLVSGDIPTGATVLVVYDGTRFIARVGHGMAAQSPAAVAITGGAINGTSIGATATSTVRGTVVTGIGDSISQVRAVGTVQDAGVRIDTTATGTAYVTAYDGASAGVISYNHADDKWRVRAGGAGTQLLVNNSGVMVGAAELINPTLVEYGCSLSTDGLGTFSASNNVALRVKRSNDGTLVQFYSGVTQEAVISVASGTVTYGSFCGTHWSQGPNELPGTIYETIDDMAEWDGEENDKLPRARPAEEASPAVYGVFSHMDEDGDLHIASLGALFVRLQPGAEPRRGDLIMSAGGGLGRVQPDDIVRASTVAKITSGRLIRSYPDGSLLFPCTLHCG